MTSSKVLVWMTACCLLVWMTAGLGCKPADTPSQPSPAGPPAPAAPSADVDEAGAPAEPAAEAEVAEGEVEGAADEEPAAADEPEEMPEPKPAGNEDEPEADQSAVVAPHKPASFPPVPVPDDNPMTEAKIELGKLLYFDKRLSADETISCATCHDPTMGWAEHRPTSEGIGGQLGEMNSPTVINAAYAPAQFWDGRAATLEEQALGPIENPVEMGHALPKMIEGLSKLSGYTERFQEVFGTDITAEGVAKAIAAFERTIISGESPYDRFKAGDESAMTEEQQEGLDLFMGVGCTGCHRPPLFSNYAFMNAGIGMDKEEPDVGRKAVTGKDSDMGKFRVPPLREVADTHPYFHDGSAATLEEAVAVMAAGGKENPNLSAMLKSIAGSLSDEDQQKIVAFLKALTSDYPVVEPPELP